MSTPYEIILSPEAQTFQINLAGTLYQLTLRYNAVHGSWMLDISTTDQQLIVGGIPLVTGVDLLEQYEYLGIKGQLFVQSTGDVMAIPGYNDLGGSGRLFFVTET